MIKIRLELILKVKDEDLIIASDEHGMLYFWNFSLLYNNYSLEKLEINCRTKNANSIYEISNKKLVFGDYKNMKIIDIKLRPIETLFVLNDIINVILSIENILL